jgi:FKBP-type peptidyl-prolyl cis-trans isomerase FkpA
MGDQMNRILLILLLFSAGLSGCTKSNDAGTKVKAQAAIDKKIITNYLESNNLPQQHVDTTDVYYLIDTLTTGNALFTSSTQITVGYTGQQLKADETLGAIFAQTNNFHPSYVLGAVMRGWQLGIPKIQQGGTITLFLPSRYAYGPYPQPNLNLPANAVLVFRIKLYNVTN